MQTTRPARFATGAANWWGLWTLYIKEVRRFFKVPAQTLVAPTATALLMLAIFSLALGGALRTVGDVPFLEFLAPGLIMMTIIQSAFANTSSSIVISKLQGNIVDLLMTPLSSGEIALGIALGGLSRGLVASAVLLAAMQPFVQVWPQHFGYVVFHAAAAGLALAQFGLITGIWADKFDQMAAATNFIITPAAFLSGTFYSIERLPEFLQAVSQFNPFFYMIDGFRYGFIGTADGSLAAGIAVMVGVNVALWLVCHRMLTSGYKLKP